MANNTSINRVYKINIIRTISFLIFYGLFGVGNFWFFRSYVLLAALVIFAVLPFFSFYFLKRLSENVSIGLYRSDEFVTEADSLGVGLIIDNKSIFSSLSANCYLNFGNSYYNEQSTQQFCVPVIAKTVNTNPIICESTSCGLIEISIEKCEILDSLGFVKCIMKFNETSNIAILPQIMELSDIQKSGIVSGYADNEDDTKQGNEYSDVSDIRNYIPGDRIKDIHWKLSSKRDILLVKEHIRTCENKLLIWIDYSTIKKQNELILKTVNSVARYSISEGILINMLWLENDNRSINVSVIGSVTELNDTFMKLYKSISKLKTDDISALLYSNNIKTNKILRIGFNDSKVDLYIYEI